MKPVIWLAGYGNANSHETLRDRVLAMNLLVIDVRMRPYSRREHWNGEDLLDMLSDRHYQHWPWWGNPRTDGTISIADFDRGLAMLQTLGEMVDPYPGVVLLCSHRALSQCHRGELGKRLRPLGYKVRNFVWRKR